MKRGCYSTLSNCKRDGVWCCKTYRRQPVVVRFYSEQLLIHSTQRLATLPSCAQLQQRVSSSIRTENTVRQAEPLSALLKNCTHPDNCRASTRLPAISQTLRQRFRMRSPCASLSEPDNCPTIVDTCDSPTIIKLAPTSHYPAPPVAGLLRAPS